MSRDYAALIRAIAPKADKQFVASFAQVADRQFAGRPWLNDTALAGVLAHMGHETMGFTKFVENMNYSARRICQVWPSRFPTIASAQPYANNPQKLANKVYANRMGNGGPETGDGWANRGGGGLQHTGKAEYDRVKRTTGYDAEQVRTAARADAILAAALSYCEARKVTSALASGDMNGSTVLINGGKIGLADRKILYNRAKAAVAAQPGAPVTANAARTTAERMDASARNAKATAGGAVAAGAGSAATATVQPTKPATAPENAATMQFLSPAMGWAAAALIIAGCAAVLWRRAQALHVTILKDAAETADARAADEPNPLNNGAAG